MKFEILWWPTSIYCWAENNVGLFFFQLNSHRWVGCGCENFISLLVNEIVNKNCYRAPSSRHIRQKLAKWKFRTQLLSKYWISDQYTAKVNLNYKFVTSSPDLSKQVSMFKKNYDHLPKDTYFGMYKDSVRGNPNYFLTYGNGKSAARIQDHLRPNGAHRWHNYMKTPKYDLLITRYVCIPWHFCYFPDSSSQLC